MIWVVPVARHICSVVMILQIDVCFWGCCHSGWVLISRVRHMVWAVQVGIAICIGVRCPGRMGYNLYLFVGIEKMINTIVGATRG